MPVGSVYINADVATNPATLLGYGTWVSLGAGRVLLGVGTGTDANGVQETFALGATGGEYEHVQTEAELRAHVHDQQIWTGGSTYNTPAAAYLATNNTGPISAGPTTSTGSSAAMPWMQPYIAVHIWKRSA